MSFLVANLSCLLTNLSYANDEFDTQANKLDYCFLGINRCIILLDGDMFANSSRTDIDGSENSTYNGKQNVCSNRALVKGDISYDRS